MVLFIKSAIWQGKNGAEIHNINGIPGNTSILVLKKGSIAGTGAGGRAAGTKTILENFVSTASPQLQEALGALLLLLLFFMYSFRLFYTYICIF